MNARDERSTLEILDDIVVWGGRIPELLGAISFEEFRRDFRTHLAVWKCIEVIGEVSGSLLKGDPALSAAFREKLRLAYQMRNRLTYGYPGVDLGILWTTARTSIPPFVVLARGAAADLGGD